MGGTFLYFYSYFDWLVLYVIGKQQSLKSWMGKSVHFIFKDCNSVKASVFPSGIDAPRLYQKLWWFSSSKWFQMWISERASSGLCLYPWQLIDMTETFLIFTRFCKRCQVSMGTSKYSTTIIAAEQLITYHYFLNLL